MRTLKGQAVVRNESNPSDYPFDRILNAVPGVSAGTPGEEKTFGDILQGIYEVLRRAGITPDETPEKKDSSQFADAVLNMQPIAIIRAGWDGDNAQMTVFGGKYAEGYSATFVESSVLGDTGVLCKLTVKKNGVVTTENLLVSVSQAYFLAAPINSASHGYNQTPAYLGWYFQNDDAGNIFVGDADSAAIADLRVRTNLLITVYKV